MSKIIAAMFVAGAGWGFIVAGKVEAIKVVLPFIIAISLLYGGWSVANVLSGNKYTCKSLEMSDSGDVDPAEGSVCNLASIDQYRIGQVWKKCTGSTISTCTEEIKDTLFTAKDDIVALIGCQIGTYKVAATATAMYKCNESNGFEVYDLANSVANMCIPYCNFDTIVSYFSNNPEVRAVHKNDNGNNTTLVTAVRGNTDIADIKKISGDVYVSSEGYKQGTIIKVVCDTATGSYELTTGGSAAVTSAIQLKCSSPSGRLVMENGSCAKSCKFSDIGSYKDNVATWKKGTEGSSTYTNITSKLDGTTTFKYKEKIKIVTCSSGYEMEDTGSNKGAEFSCSEGGNWSGNVSGVTGNTCEKSCSSASLIQTLKDKNVLSSTGTLSTFAEGEIMYTTRNSDTKVAVPSSTTKFFKSQRIYIKKCKTASTTYKMRTKNHRVASEIEFRCQSGSWITEDEGACYLFCGSKDLYDPDDTTETKVAPLFSRHHISEVAIYSSASRSAVIGYYDSSNHADAVIYEGDVVRVSRCSRIAPTSAFDMGFTSNYYFSCKLVKDGLVDLDSSTGFVQTDSGLFWSDASHAQYKIDINEDATLQGKTFCVKEGNCKVSEYVTAVASDNDVQSDDKLTETIWKNMEWQVCYATGECKIINSSLRGTADVVVPAGGSLKGHGCKSGYKLIGGEDSEYAEYICDGTLTRTVSKTVNDIEIMYKLCKAGT
jgi:hypothetical protein